MVPTDVIMPSWPGALEFVPSFRQQLVWNTTRSGWEGDLAHHVEVSFGRNSGCDARVKRIVWCTYFEANAKCLSMGGTAHAPEKS